MDVRYLSNLILNLSTDFANDEAIKFTNCQLIRNGKVVKDDLWVRNKTIVNPEPIFYEEQAQEHYLVDCHNAIIAPGFIDVQINGGFGYDLSSDPLSINDALRVVRKGVLSSGVTAICPTIVTSPIEIYSKIIPKIRRCVGGKEGAEILGIHLEGPFISPEKKGAHPVNYIRNLSKGIDSLKETYGDLKDVAMVTLAPELPGANKVIKSLVENNNIVVSLGHSNGNLTDGEMGVNNGASFITHLFNAMLPFHHRDPGLVGLLTSQFTQKSIYYGIIADGIHTHPAAIRIAQRTHPKGIVLVTDAMAALGLSEGLHKIGQLEVEVKGRKAFLVGTDTLAGSIAPMDECIRRFIKAAGVSLVDAVEAASLHPARALGIDHRKGSLNFGVDADLVFLDNSQPEMIDVTHTLIGGELVYTSPKRQPLVFKKCNQ